MRSVSVAPGPVCPPGSDWVVWLLRPGVSLQSNHNFERKFFKNISEIMPLLF